MKRRTFLGFCSLAAVGRIAWGAEGKKENKENKKEKKKPKAVDESDIDVHGKPKQLTNKKHDENGVYIWLEDGTWHVETTSAKGRHDFTGIIEVDGGTFEQGVKTRKMELGKDPGGLVRYHEGRLAFALDTGRGRDKFTFKVTPESKSLKFDIEIDGDYHPKKISIGAAGTHPEGCPFIVSAK